MSDLSVEEFDLHPSFISDAVWPALIGDRPWWKKASTWCLIFGVLIAFLFGAIVVLLNGNEQQLLLNVNNQQLELLDKLEKNFQINSAFENKHKVIANEIEGIINASIEHYFLKLGIIVAMATVLIIITIKLWRMVKIALIRRNTPQPSEVKMVEEPETNNDVNDNSGQQLLMVDELPEERGVQEGEEEFTDEEEGRKLKEEDEEMMDEEEETKHEEEEESTDEEKEEMLDEEEEKESTKKHSHTHKDVGRKFKCPNAPIEQRMLEI